MTLLSRRSAIAALVATGLSACTPKASGPSGLKAVKFGMLPYGDHTQASIGIAKGWFQKAGIDLQARVIRIEEVVPFLQNGTYDVISTPPGVLIAAHNDAPGLVMATFGDLFQGYAILARTDRGYKSAAEFAAGGSTPTKALAQAVDQLRGERFAYPPEGGVRPFIDLVLETGGLSTGDIHPMVVDDPVGVAAMKRGDADFFVGGVPARLTLQKAGFKVIAAAVDFARLAAPSPTSKALQAVLPGGWAMKRSLFESDPDLVLRLACVSFQINDLINTNPQEAGEIHMKYLSQATGQVFDQNDAKIIYGDLDPFLTFEEQDRWFSDKNYQFYYENIIGAQIEAFREDKAFRGTAPSVGDIIVADEVYRQLKALQGRCAADPSLEKKAQTELGVRGYFACR